MKSVTIEAKTFAEMLGITEGELIFAIKKTGTFKNKTIPQPHEPHKSNNRFLYSDVMRFIESLKPEKRFSSPAWSRFCHGRI
ncbi:hypothetical protein EF552_23895 [Salmonella enterica subsp. enterica serovar Gallinarum]|nr:hypothetical protein [Salmonella enterica subsp. enterica serovar Gallinarum]EBN4623598.1 hypothetical protein [Salmonella enterica]EBH9861142.1 hypothetical protein [Salmonella enterica subsp. enterica serovar Gallinarum]EBH9864222.1 hypothetical protein [Salmonella enterica subsp. enterica serovar Gallinarum]EBH9865518.1 hypothetical protein [Salmonella enterica subsp. enterica serovar Gallinarum]